MDGNPEAALDGVRHALAAAVRAPGPPRLGEVEDLLGALVGMLGAAPAREQAREPVGSEGGVRSVEGLAAHLEAGGDLGHGPAVDPVPAQHLVLHLDPVARIEELVAGEGLVPNRLGTRVEGARGPEGRGPGILHGRLPVGHQRHLY